MYLLACNRIFVFKGQGNTQIWSLFITFYAKEPAWESRDSTKMRNELSKTRKMQAPCKLCIAPSPSLCEIQNRCGVIKNIWRKKITSEIHTKTNVFGAKPGRRRSSAHFSRTAKLSWSDLQVALLRSNAKRASQPVGERTPRGGRWCQFILL